MMELKKEIGSKKNKYSMVSFQGISPASEGPKNISLVMLVLHSNTFSLVLFPANRGDPRILRMIVAR